MSDHDNRARSLAIEIAEETVKQYRLTAETVGEQIDRTLSIIALMVFDMSEADLRDYLTMSGVNLTDYSSFELAQNYVGWYVAAHALEINDLFSFSLVSMESSLAQQYMEDEDMQARMDLIKTDGIFFREIMCGNIEK